MLRTTLCLVALLCWTSLLSAEPPTEKTSTIESVTVYPQNAKVTRLANVKVGQGETELLFTGISSKFLTNSVQVKLGNSKASIVSVTPRINYLKEVENSKRAQVLEDSSQIIERKLALMKIQLDGLNARRSVLMDNNPLASAEKQGFTIAEMQQFMAFREKNLVAVDTEIYELKEANKKFNEQYQRLQRALQQINGKLKVPSGEVLLKVKSSQALSMEVSLSFVVSGASWVPIYDLRSKSIEEPVQLHYKAKVRQSTGYDWKNVQLLLSTSNPTQNNERPILSPSYVDLADTYVHRNSKGIARGRSSSAPNMNSYGAYRDAPDESDEEVSSILADIVPSSFEFLLDNKQTIPSDNEQHVVEINKHELPAVYEYHTVPKVNKGAFLLAKITDYGQYKLLRGKANIFFEGTYIGESEINPEITTDTMPLSFGLDERIVVNREQVLDKTSKKTIGFNKKEELVYEISVRNNKSEAISIEVLDQVPISRNNDLEVELLEGDKGDYSEKYGSILWRLTIPPNETKKIRLSYSLKYPKSKVVSGNNY